MRTLATYGMAALLLLAAQAVLGQPASEPAGNPDEAGENNPRAAMQKKRAACPLLSRCPARDQRNGYETLPGDWRSSGV